MKKIPSVFQRNYDGDRLIRDEVTPGCEWVLAGEGTPTEKVDGTACMIRGALLYRRRDVKQGKPTPPNFEPCEPAPDPVTGHWPGWIPVGNGPEDREHREAMDNLLRLRPIGREDNGTYELVGPKIQGNPYRLDRHELWRHGLPCSSPAPSFAALRDYLSAVAIEGIVYWHPDGRMAKVKARDFGIKWPR